jgi:hypothetical protein
MATAEIAKADPVRVVLPMQAKLILNERNELLIRVDLNIEFSADSLREERTHAAKDDGMRSMECEGFIVWRGTVKRRSVPFLGIGDN